MKHFFALFFCFISLVANAAVPTEEGLLKNLNNASIPGNLITIKAMAQMSPAVVVAGGETEAPRNDFYKFVLSTENPGAISLLQVAYSNGQMLTSQIKDIKYVPDLIAAIKREKSPERGLFYGLLIMLATNQSKGMETFLEKSGIQIVKNRNILNEEKLKLLRAYRTYLANNKGKGDANSPLNPADPQAKAKVLELFRANTFERAKNIELVKLNNDFVWKVDWKNIQAYFSNEERRFNQIDCSYGDSSLKIEASEYVLFNGTNELPKYLSLKDLKGQVTKLQILGLDTKTNREKKLSERFEEAKKAAPAAQLRETYSFFF